MKQHAATGVHKNAPTLTCLSLCAVGDVQHFDTKVKVLKPHCDSNPLHVKVAVSSICLSYMLRWNYSFKYFVYNSSEVISFLTYFSITGLNIQKNQELINPQ